MERESRMMHNCIRRRDPTNEGRYVVLVESLVECVDWGACKDR